MNKEIELLKLKNRKARLEAGQTECKNIIRKINRKIKNISK